MLESRSRGKCGRSDGPTSSVLPALWRRPCCRSFSLALTLGAAAGSAFAGGVLPGAAAQEKAGQPATGQIVGVVRAGSGASTLPVVPVTVISTDTTVLSEPDGAFMVTAPAGAQQIRVRVAGYEEVVAPVHVPAGGTARLELVLNGESLTEDMVVTGEAAQPAPLTAAAQLAEEEKASAAAEELASDGMKRIAESNTAERGAGAESNTAQRGSGAAPPMDIKVRFSRPGTR